MNRAGAVVSISVLFGCLVSHDNCTRKLASPPASRQLSCQFAAKQPVVGPVAARRSPVATLRQNGAQIAPI